VGQRNARSLWLQAGRRCRPIAVVVAGGEVERAVSWPSRSPPGPRSAGGGLDTADPAPTPPPGPPQGYAAEAARSDPATRPREAGRLAQAVRPPRPRRVALKTRRRCPTHNSLGRQHRPARQQVGEHAGANPPGRAGRRGGCASISIFAAMRWSRLRHRRSDKPTSGDRPQANERRGADAPAAPDRRPIRKNRLTRDACQWLQKKWATASCHNDQCGQIAKS